MHKVYRNFDRILTIECTSQEAIVITASNELHLGNRYCTERFNAAVGLI